MSSKCVGASSGAHMSPVGTSKRIRDWLSIYQAVRVSLPLPPPVSVFCVCPWETSDSGGSSTCIKVWSSIAGGNAAGAVLRYSVWLCRALFPAIAHRTYLSIPLLLKKSLVPFTRAIQETAGGAQVDVGVREA